MSETTDTAPAGEQPTEQSQTGDFTPISSQEDLDKIIQSRLARERSKYADYEDLKARAAKHDATEEANKTELQKAVERAEKAEKDLASATSNSERLKVIATHQIPEEYQDLLTATDAEGLKNQAEKIQQLIKPKGPIVPTEGRQPTQSSGATDWLREKLQQK